MYEITLVRHHAPHPVGRQRARKRPPGPEKNPFAYRNAPIGANNVPHHVDRLRFEALDVAGFDLKPEIFKKPTLKMALRHFNIVLGRTHDEDVVHKH